MTRIRSFLVLLALVGATPALVGCGKKDEPATADTSASSIPKAPRSLTRVETAVVTPSVAALRLTMPGEVDASRDANLAAAMGGFIEKVVVKPGQKVRKGQILALIDTTSQTARRHQAHVEVKAAKREYERAKKMGDAIARSQVDAAEARYDAARAGLHSASVAVDRTIIKAPFSGTIAKVDIEVGEVAGPGAPIIRVVQLDPIKITISLSDRDVQLVKVGMTAQIRTDAQQTLVDGKVIHVEPAADLNTRAFLAEVEVPNPDHTLLPGMIATIALNAGSNKPAMVLSQDWIVTRPNELGVFVVNRTKGDGEVASWRKILAGPVVGDRVVLLGGLSSGEEIVTTGHRELSHGDALLVARKGKCCIDGRLFFEGDQTSKRGAVEAAPQTTAAAAAAAKGK